jgi:hypothetical protein
VLCAAPAAVIAGEALPSASSGDHAWIIVDHAASTQGLELFHHARTMDGPYYDKGLRLPRMPEAMEAWGNRLWLIFETPTRREVFTTQARWNQAVGAWFHDPHDRLRAATPFEQPGTLLDATATARGPMVLMVQDDRAVLWRLLDRKWEPVPLPAGSDFGLGCHLVACGVGGEQLVLVEPVVRGTATVHWRDAGGVWINSVLPAGPGPVRTLTGVGPPWLPGARTPAQPRCPTCDRRGGCL